MLTVSATKVLTCWKPYSHYVVKLEPFEQLHRAPLFVNYIILCCHAAPSPINEPRRRGSFTSDLVPASTRWGLTKDYR